MSLISCAGLFLKDVPLQCSTPIKQSEKTTLQFPVFFKLIRFSKWIDGNSLEKKYNPVASKTLLTASCTAFVYGTLK